MIALCFISSIISGLLLALCYVHLIKYRTIRNVPGPSVFLTILGMFCPKPTMQEAFDLMINLNKKYGSVVKIWMNPFLPKLIVTDLKYIEKLLSSTAHLEKTMFYRYLESFGLEGLATVSAARWKSQRKIFNPAFRNKTLEEYVETFAKFGDELIKEMTKYEGGPSFDVIPPATTCALNIICATLMQLKSAYAEKDLSEFYDAKDGFFKILLSRPLSILTQYNFLFRFTGAHTEKERHAKILNDFSVKLIDTYRRQETPAKFEEDKHVVDYLLENFGLRSKGMLDHVGTFMVAGYETVATALGFALYELAKHPEIQRKIVEETDSVLGENRHVQAAFSDLQNLKYLECVIKETLRKYSVVPIVERTTTEPMEINGVRVPEGTEIAICTHGVHLDEGNYPNPDVFDPDRFLPENESKIHPFAYLPFSLGPRNCIGKQFAILEVKSLLATFLRHYEVLPAETHAKMEFFTEFSLKSTIGTPIRIKPRSKMM